MAAKLIVQLLRMLRTPEEEIAELLNRKKVAHEPSPELVRKLCMLQLDIIADMATATVQVRSSYRRQIDQLWSAHLVQEAEKEKEMVLNGCNGKLKSPKNLVASASLSLSSSSSRSGDEDSIPDCGLPLIDLSYGDYESFPDKKKEKEVLKKIKRTGFGDEDYHNDYYANGDADLKSSSSSENILSMKTIHLLYMLFRKLTIPEWIIDALLYESNNVCSQLFSPENSSSSSEDKTSSTSAFSATLLELFSRLLAIEEEFSQLPAVSTTDTHTLAAYRDLVITLWTNYHSPLQAVMAKSRAEAIESRFAEAATAHEKMTVINPAPNSVVVVSNDTAKNHKDIDGFSSSTAAAPPTTIVTPLVAPTISSHSMAVAKTNTVHLIERTFAHIRPINGNSPFQPEQLKEVVNALSKAIKQCRQFVKDEQVQARAVAALLPKLPEAMRAAFVDRCERRIDERSLKHLKLFVSSEMAVLYAARGVEEVANKQLPQSQQVFQLEQYYQPPLKQEPPKNNGHFRYVHQPRQQPSQKPSFATVANSSSRNGNFNFSISNGNANYKNHSNRSNDKSDNSNSYRQQQPSSELPHSSQHCAYCKTAGHLITDCPEKNSAICYKCSGTGHIAKHCPSRLEAIRLQLADLLDRIALIAPEDINLHKLVGLLERADLLTQPVWREESLQAYARERLLPKLSPGLRERFLARCAVGGKRVTIRELKGFLVYELKAHPYRVSAFNGYGNGVKAATNGNIEAVGEEQPKQPCSKCGSKKHLTNQCADLLQILGVE